MVLLDILVPTYARPSHARRAMETILMCSDPRFILRCSSNKVEPQLERFARSDSRIIYNEFEKNMGANANFLYLLKHSKSQFCMLLSDEDWLDPASLPAFLDFLEGLPAETTVISCSIYEDVESDYYFKPSEKLDGFHLGGNSFAALDLSPTYMSGLVFSVPRLKSIPLDDLYVPSPGNAYPHLDTAQRLLVSGVFRYYEPRLVIKGKSAEQGGGAFSHRENVGVSSSDNADLIPSVYRPYARARQFFYRENLYGNLGSEISRIAKTIARFALMRSFLNGVWTSHRTVVLSPEVNYRNEASRAYLDAIEEGEFSRSLFARSFRHMVALPSFLRSPALFCLRALSWSLRKAHRQSLVPRP